MPMWIAGMLIGQVTVFSGIFALVPNLAGSPQGLTRQCHGNRAVVPGTRATAKRDNKEARAHMNR